MHISPIRYVSVNLKSGHVAGRQDLKGKGKDHINLRFERRQCVYRSERTAG